MIILPGKILMKLSFTSLSIFLCVNGTEGIYDFLDGWPINIKSQTFWLISKNKIERRTVKASSNCSLIADSIQEHYTVTVL